MTQGAVKVDPPVFVLDVQYRKKSFLKFYCKHANILADQKEYTLNTFSYLLILGLMEKEDFLCVNVTKHEMVKYFDNNQLMREHWVTCQNISLTDEVLYSNK